MKHCTQLPICPVQFCGTMKECILRACKLRSVKRVSSWLTQFLFILSDIAVCRTALGQAHQLGVQQRIRSREGDRKITNRSGTLARAVWVTKFSYAGALWSWFSWLYMFELVNCAVFLSWNQESWQIWSLSTSCNMMRRTALGHQLLNLVDFDVYASLANQFISKKSDV